ncbi:MAG: hypothetical protein KDE51_19135, partial [Anaerolineales bacterium]|nr:hypothetical protein [Anaerolineales bacterium]
VLKTTDEGQTWSEISPDLTRNDPDKLQKTGGPINLDSIGAETYCTVYAIAESPQEAGVLWAGSDDGLVHLSKDGGANWENVTPPDLPEWSMINMIELSPHDAATVYVAAAKYKLDDYTPYIYKSADYGQTWTLITNGIRENDYVRAIRCDPNREGLLYAGTETGIYVSFDEGVNWQPFNLNLPVCPVYDLIIKDNDLIAGTHGRAMWILDDITPLHQLMDQSTNPEAVRLLKPRDTTRLFPPLFYGWGGGAPGKNYTAAFTEITTFTEEKTDENAVIRHYLDAGEDRPLGVTIGYHLPEAAADLKLEILDKAGQVIRTYTHKPAESEEMSAEQKEELKSKLYAPAKAGYNRLLWDMRYEDGTKIKGKDMTATRPLGPVASLGQYKVRLTVGEEVQTHAFNITADPRVDTPAADYEAQLALLLQIRDKISEANEAVNTLRDIREQIDGWLKRVTDEAVQSAGKALKEQLLEIEKPLIAPGVKTRSQALNEGTRLIEKLGSLQSYVASADFKPTAAGHEHFTFLSKLVDEQLAAYDTALGAQVASFNQLVAKTGAAAVVIG